jgi:hypothetical protein
MTTYYYGNIEFGRFTPNSITTDSFPIAIIHRVNEVKEFDTPAQAWDHYINSNGEHESYVGFDAKDESNVQYELVFKQHR